MGANLKPKVESFQRKQANSLAKLVKALSKESEAAVERLVVLSGSKDEKIALDATKAIITLHKEMEESVNRDEIQRKIAALKFPTGGPTQLVEDDDGPQIDFNSIQMIE